MRPERPRGRFGGDAATRSSAEARAAERWFRFLAEASSVLADWCVVDVLEADGEVRRVATAHADPRKKALVRELTRFPPDPEKEAGVPHVLRTGQAALFPEVTLETLRQVAQDEDHLRLNVELGSRSALWRRFRCGSGVRGVRSARREARRTGWYRRARNGERRPHAT